MLSTGLALDGPSAVRYPRGTGPGVVPSGRDEPLEVGRGETRREGQRIALLAFGAMLTPALEAGEALDATVVNMRFVKPIDSALILELADRHALLVTIEENVVAGGAGSAVSEALRAAGRDTPLLQLGLPDRFLPLASTGELLAGAGLDASGIRRAAEARLAALVNSD